MLNIARTLAANVKAMVPGQFEAVPATPETHPHADWAAYRRVRQKAESLGFRHLADIDPVSAVVDAAMSKRPVLAMYVNPDGTECLGHYRFAPRWTVKGILSRFMGAMEDYIDIGTTFGGADGVVVSTSNAQLAGVWSNPAFILKETLKQGTPLEVVVKRHRQRVAKYRAGHPDVPPVAVQTLEEGLALSDNVERRKLEWRREFGWASKDEIARVTKLKGPALDQVYAQFKQYLAEQPPTQVVAATPTPDAIVTAPARVSLQFDRVDLGTPAARPSAATMACATCTMPITGQYYDVDGRSVCESCKDIAVRENEPARGAGTFFKALLRGGVATLVGAGIYYGVAAITGLEIGLIALVIGVMVGAAVRSGTAGKGGRLYQVMALTLTYFAVGLAYTPFALKGLMDGSTSDSTAVRDSIAGVREDSLGLRTSLSPVVPRSVLSESARVVTPAGATTDVVLDSIVERVDATAIDGGSIALGLTVGIVGAFLMAFALPIFAVLSTLPSGLISALIIGIGMHQAWKMTAAAVHTVSGPYRVGAAPGASTPPAST